MQDFKLVEAISPSTFPDTKEKETPQRLSAGASICSLVETGEGALDAIDKRPGDHLEGQPTQCV